MEDTPASSRSKIITGVIAVAIVLVLIAAVMAFKKKDDSALQATVTATPETTQESETTPNEAPTAKRGTPDASTEAATTYKAGSYTAEGSYNSPGGTESVVVQLTLAGDKISDISVTPTPASPTSTEFQGKFVSGYKNLVLGKDIDEVELSRVSGSSLTSRGFNAALDDIKSQARI